MTDKFDIPNPMRDFAETSVEQARKAFDDYLAAAQKAIGGFGTSAASAQENVRTLGEDAISFAEENMAANFDFAKQMVSSRTIEDMVNVQSRFIERQMAAFTKHVHTRPTFPHEMRKPSGLHVLEGACCLL